MYVMYYEQYSQKINGKQLTKGVLIQSVILHGSNYLSLTHTHTHTDTHTHWTIYETIRALIVLLIELLR